LRHITGGDNNPDCQLGAFAPSYRVALSLAAGPAVPAIACFARLCTSEDRTPYQEPFPFSPVTSVSDDEGEYILRSQLSRENHQLFFEISTAEVQILSRAIFARCIRRWIS